MKYLKAIMKCAELEQEDLRFIQWTIEEKDKLEAELHDALDELCGNKFMGVRIEIITKEEKETALRLAGIEMIEFEVTDLEFQEMTPYPVPHVIAMRMLLEKKGMKFEDSGKLSSVVNYDPKPIGYVKQSYDVAKGVTKYQQVIEG